MQVSKLILSYWWACRISKAANKWKMLLINKKFPHYYRIVFTAKYFSQISIKSWNRMKIPCNFKKLFSVLAHSMHCKICNKVITEILWFELTFLEHLFLSSSQIFKTIHALSLCRVGGHTSIKLRKIFFFRRARSRILAAFIWFKLSREIIQYISWTRA